MAAQKSLLPLVKKYFEDDPLQAAHHLETMSEEEAVTVLKSLPPHLSSQAFPYLQVGYAAALLKEIPAELCRQISERLDPQQAASLFMNLPNETRQKLLDNLPEKTKWQIQELLLFPENSAGRIMTTDFFALKTDIKVKEAIQKIRLTARRKSTAS